MYKKLHVLCFGDSLSAGFFKFGLEYHPYDGKLKETLQSQVPDLKVFTDVEGLPGDLVTFPGSFSMRMENKCNAGKYDWVICLGGTKLVLLVVLMFLSYSGMLISILDSDLGYGRATDRIYNGLQETWQIALGSGAKLLALTIPECQVRSQSLDARRAEVNASILAHKADGL